jgi:predicted nucleotidyltransferase
MIKQDAISALAGRAPLLRRHGATALYLFGSTARDRAGPASDIDLFIDYDAASGFSLIDLAAIKLLLESQLGAPVDVTTRDSLDPRLRAGIENSAIQIF